MIKVLVVYTHTAPGGGETMLLRMVDGFDRKRIEPYVAVSGRNERLQKELQRIGVPFDVIRDTNLPWKNKFIKAIIQIPNFIYLNAKLFGIILRQKPDVVHAGLFYSALFSFLPAKLLGKKFIWVGQTTSDFFGYPVLSRFLLRFSDATVLTCDDFNRLLKEHAMPGRDKTAVIYTGLPKNYFRRRPSGPVAHADGRDIPRPMVGFFARYEPVQKGHPYFFEAAKIIHDTVPGANFLIAGGVDNEAEAAYKKKLEALSDELGIREHVFFVDYINDLAAFLPYVDVVMIPSSYEAPSAVAIEASAAGRPVVAFAVGGIPEVIKEGETGFLLPHGDARGLAEKTVLLLRDPAKADAMGETGRQFVSKTFVQEKLVDDYTRLYESL